MGQYQLDDIERVIDHATWELQSWEPKRKELDAIYEIGGMTKDYEMAIGRLFVKKYQEWLAKQCGEEPRPCDKCQFYHRKYKQDPQCDLYNCNPFERGHKCPEWMHWQGRREGQQQGYAKGLAEAESKVKAREREIVEWLKGQQRTDQLGRLLTHTPFGMAQDLEAWLQGKE